MIEERIAFLREERGLSQVDLASLIGVSHASIGNYERGKRQPDAETIARIAKYFGVSADYLLGLSDKRPRSRRKRSKFGGLLRERGRLSQISKETGISRTTLTSLCFRTSKGVQFETLKKLSEYLSLTPGDLVNLMICEEETD